ncbi:hypothetical protein BCR44DRAFT_58911 [Catenaria anguillulae PL171]|uniref:Uncharacterized protein n=1 Tax=Catenaria anguillulae PL171 TaxID=765915 RepID=A0A1Y2HI71_9FUNG|nr:hypothetical protein BCR44DRAFT_58911 [Catenaria anguillulae PL171]
MNTPLSLSRIAAGISSLHHLDALLFPPPPAPGSASPNNQSDNDDQDPMISPIRHLNLHANRITHLESSVLSRLRLLVSLDLSSNALVNDNNHAFPPLPHLQSLNLASNQLTAIPAFTHVPCLRRLILAYNSIQSLNGIVHLHGQASQLEILDLQSNRIASPAELYLLSGLVKLRHLHLDNNPVLTATASSDSSQSTTHLTWSILPTLFSLDGHDRVGAPVDNCSMNLEFMLAGSSSSPPLRLLGPVPQPPPAPEMRLSAPQVSPTAHDPASYHQQQQHQQHQQQQQDMQSALVDLKSLLADFLTNKPAPAPTLAAATAPPVQHIKEHDALKAQLKAMKKHLAKLEQQQQQQQQQQVVAPKPPPPTSPPAPPMPEALKSLESELAHLHALDAQRTQDLKSLTEALRAERARVAQLEQQLQSERQARHDVEQAYEAAKRKHQDAHNEVGKWKAVARSVASERDKYDEARNRVAEMQEHVMQLKTELYSLNAQLEQAQAHAKEAERGFTTRLDEALKHERASHDHVLSELKSAHAQVISTLHAQLAAARAQIDQADHTHSRHSSVAQSQLDLLQSDLTKFKSQAESATAKLAAASIEATQLRAAVAQLQTERLALRDAVKTQQAHVTQLNQSLADVERLYESRVAKVKEKLRAATQAGMAAQAQTKRCEDELAHVRMEEARWRERCGELERRVEELRGVKEEVERVRREVEAARQVAAIKDKQVADQAETIKHLKGTLAAKVAEFQDVSRKVDGVRELEFEIQTRDRDIQRLEDLVTEYRSERNAARSQVAHLQSKLDDQAEALAVIETEAASMRSTLAAKLAHLERQLDEHRSAHAIEVKELKRVAVEARERVREAEEASHAWRERGERAEAKVREVQEQGKMERDALEREVKEGKAKLDEVLAKWNRVCHMFMGEAGATPASSGNMSGGMVGVGT